MSHVRLIVCCLVSLSFLSAMGGTLAHFRTAFGTMEVELFDEDKPETVRNFIRYVESGQYTNMFAHRLVPNAVFQAGGFAVTNRGTTNWATVAVPAYAPVSNEFARGKFYSNVFGTLAMATIGGNPDSAASQFFFNLTNNSAAYDNPANNGGYTVFGRVVAGTNVLGRLNTFKYWLPQLGILPQPTNVVLYYFAPPFDTWPLLYPALQETNFLYLDISLLKVRLQVFTNRTAEISWNSAVGLTNYVESATNLPPVWRSLYVTNGNGADLKLMDGVSGSAARFYRVRVAN